MQRILRDFAAARFEADGPTRDLIAPPEHRPHDYIEKYDHKTLWYDAIWEANQVTLVLPKPLNFEGLLKSADIRLDDKPATIDKFRLYRRHAVLTLPASNPVKSISVESDNWRLESPVHIAEPDLLRGLNTAVTMSKDNDLTWITDWAHFHIAHHGLEAMVFIDNESKSYGADQIFEALAGLGLKTVIFASTPLTYGATAKPGPYRHGSTFLQTGHLNAIRRRFLTKARAVLQIDVDELVWSQGNSIFDLCKESRFGFVRFPGTWRCVSSIGDDVPRHVDHRYFRADRGTCPHKYCIDPQGRFGDLEYNPHRLEGSVIAQAFNSKKAGFWHCASITNNWKVANRDQAIGTEEDPSVAQALDQAFSPKPPRE